MKTSNNELDLDRYLCLVDVDPDPDPPHDDAPPVTTWRDRLPGVFALVIGALVAMVVAGAGLGVVATSGSGRSSPAPVVSSGGTSIGAAAMSPAAGASGGAGPSVASAPLGATRAAQFQLDPGTTVLRVRAVDLGDLLFRAVTRSPSGAAPQTVRDGGRVRVRSVPGPAGAATGALDVELNRRVEWQVTLVGGAASATVDLRGARVSGVDFTGGVERIELWLARARGAVPVRMSGGARDMTVHAPKGVPVRAAIGEGASSVTLDGAPHSGIAAGTRFVTTGWQQARDRYDLDLAGGVAELTIDRY